MDHHQHHLGVNKLKKKIRKRPLPAPNVDNVNQQLQRDEPRVYNVSESDFRTTVQQLTGMPVRDAGEPSVHPRPELHPPPPSSRQRRIRSQPHNPNLSPSRYAWIDSGIAAWKRYMETRPMMSYSSRQPQPLLPSPRFQFPDSQFLSQSPSSSSNLVSPRLPYPMVYPRFPQYPTMPTPNFWGLLGPCPDFQTRPLPEFSFPPSPSGSFPPSSSGSFPPSHSGSFPFPSPRWREM